MKETLAQHAPGVNSIFASTAWDYHDAGYAVIPVEGKNPNFPGWNSRKPTDVDIERWSQWQTRNIGILCGEFSEIVAVDFDHCEELHGLIKALLPPSPVRKKGSKGETWFFKFNGERSSSFKTGNGTDAKTVVDLLSTGKQCVLPPSIHPETGLPYKWLTPETLLDYSPNNLPTLPANFAEIVEGVLGTGSSKGRKEGGKRKERKTASIEKVADALAFLNPNDPYPLWVEAGMAIHSEFPGEDGLTLWRKWSSKSPKFVPGECENRWATFGDYKGRKITLGTLFKRAMEAGWSPPGADRGPDYVPGESTSTSTVLEPTPRGSDDGFLKHPLDVAERIAQLLPGLTFRQGRFFQKSADEKMIFTPVDELAVQRLALKLFERQKTENSFSVVEATVKMLRAALHKPEEVGRIVACDLNELLSADLPPREEILSPWLLTQSINMVFAPRGVGKTQLALSVALATSTAGECLRWTAHTARRTVYIDGEMSATTLQERLSKFRAASTKGYQPGMLRFVTPDLQKRPMPDLSTAHGQQEITDIIGDAELVILDNLSCLVRGEKGENDAESWVLFQEWLLSLRMQGRAIIFLHHSGKTGTQRGTSKREDVLDTVIALRQPEGYSASEGCRFIATFEKSRNMFGEDVAPFQARLVTGTSDAFAPAYSWECSNSDGVQHRVKSGGGRRTSLDPEEAAPIVYEMLCDAGALTLTDLAVRCRSKKDGLGFGRDKLRDVRAILREQHGIVERQAPGQGGEKFIGTAEAVELKITEKTKEITQKKLEGC